MVDRNDLDYLLPNGINQKKFNTLVFKAIESRTIINKLANNTFGATMQDVIEELAKQGFDSINYSFSIRFTLDQLVRFKKIQIVNRIGGDHFVTTRMIVLAQRKINLPIKQ